MNKGLKYFKEIYDEVPKWVKVMNDYNPNMLDYYTDIRSEAFDTAYITASEKDALVAAVNTGRFYDRSMIYHTFGTIKKGMKSQQLAEYILTTYLYKGLKSLKFGLSSIAYSLELEGKNVNYDIDEINNISDILELLKKWFDGKETLYLEELFRVVKNGNEVKIAEKLLQDGEINFKQKYLTIIGCYITELDGKGAKPWIIKAREAGVSDSEMADLGYICILTAGIPTWFELSDSLEGIK